jgi:hypothetical protein
MKAGANFLRDVVEFLNSRNETRNDDKTVNDLIHDFINETTPDPNHYADNGEDFMGFNKGLKFHVF